MVFRIIFESDTRSGRMFDVLLVSCILLSVMVVMLDSVQALHDQWGQWFVVLEWFFTLLFTVEYLLRLVCVDRPGVYVRSALGLIDLVSILPTYFAFFVPGLQALMDVRILRMLRIFRILKLGAYVHEYGQLWRAILASRRKIAVFLSFVLLSVLVLGTLMYVVEGPENGFTSIPVAVYWAITTVTTVGFGDISPKTDFGRLITSFIMLMGWGTLAVPTGIVSAEFVVQASHRSSNRGRHCGICNNNEHLDAANFCHACGASLESGA